MKLHLLALAFAGALSFAAAPAFAQSAGGGTPSQNTTVSNAPASVAGIITAITTSSTANTSSSLTASNTSRKVLAVTNEAAAGAGNIAVCPSSVSSPAINAAGCHTLYPGQLWSACANAVCPSDAFVVVGSVASVPVTLEQN